MLYSGTLAWEFVFMVYQKCTVKLSEVDSHYLEWKYSRAFSWVLWQKTQDPRVWGSILNKGHLYIILVLVLFRQKDCPPHSTQPGFKPMTLSCGLMSVLVIRNQRKGYGRAWHWMSTLRPGIHKQHKTPKTPSISHAEFEPLCFVSWS